MYLNKKVAAMAASAAAGVIMTLSGVSACGSGNPQLDDLQNVSPSYPNYAANYMNVSGFPNITMLCINGAGFATTTRDNSASAAFLVPEWDAFCKQQIGRQATQGGQP
jgi:hypothetical protein